MKRIVARLLCIVLIMGISLSGGSATAEKTPQLLSGSVIPEEKAKGMTQEIFETETLAQAFAVGMMCWNSYTDNIRLWEPWFAWDATGWYAAWVHRVEGIDLLTQDEVKAFQRSIGVAEEIGDPNNWLGNEGPKLLRSTGGLNYDFAYHKQRMDELLGVVLELSITSEDDLRETVTVTQHFGQSASADSTYVLSFESAGEMESAFPFRVTGLSVQERIPKTDPNLTFTWDLLAEQNSLSKILSMYPAVRIYSKMHNLDNEIWLFLHGENQVMITDAYGTVTGRYRDCFFELGMSTDGVVRPQVGGFSTGEDAKREMDDFVLSYFARPAIIELDRLEGDLIWADALFHDGYRQKLAFDRGTLVLREVMSLSESGEVVGITAFDYSDAPVEYEFLDSWDKPLRKIEVIWEDFSGGKQQQRRETIELPTDWEYLPYECRWGDYTVYTNDRCIGPYAYPGDGNGYLLFLTTAKG